MSSKEFLIAKHIRKSKYSCKRRDNSSKFPKKFKQIFEKLRNFRYNQEPYISIKPEEPALALLQENNMEKILEPYQNFSLFPKNIQNILRKDSFLNDIFKQIRFIETPIEPFSYQKMLAKVKLLTIGQQTLVKSFLKVKYFHSQTFDKFQKYYNYLNSFGLFMKKNLRNKDIKLEETNKNARDFQGINIKHNFGNFLWAINNASGLNKAMKEEGIDEFFC